MCGELCLENYYLKEWYIKKFQLFVTKIKVMSGLRCTQNITKAYFYNQKCLSFSKLGWTKSNAEKDDSYKC